MFAVHLGAVARSHVPHAQRGPYSRSLDPCVGARHPGSVHGDRAIGPPEGHAGALEGVDGQTTEVVFGGMHADEVRPGGAHRVMVSVYGFPVVEPVSVTSSTRTKKRVDVVGV